MIDSIGFDLDGTLWDSTDSITKAWRTVAAEFGVHLPSLAEMESVMGLNRIDLMKKLFPDMDKKESADFFDRATVECVKELNLHGGKLYDGVEETLRELSRHCKLYIVSNCQESYMDAFLTYHKLGKYFCDFACEDPDTLSKGENIKKVIARNKLTASVYIGDTQGDCNAAKLAGVPFGFAAYGFGTVDGYDCKFDSFNDILSQISITLGGKTS